MTERQLINDDQAEPDVVRQKPDAGTYGKTQPQRNTSCILRALYCTLAEDKHLRAGDSMRRRRGRTDVALRRLILGRARLQPVPGSRKERDRLGEAQSNKPKDRRPKTGNIRRNRAMSIFGIASHDTNGQSTVPRNRKDKRERERENLTICGHMAATPNNDICIHGVHM